MELCVKLIFCCSIILLQSVVKTTEETCSPCKCFPPGTIESIDMEDMCLETTGKCQCRKNVVGKNCNECKPGYWGIHSGKGCKSCNCNAVGSNLKGPAGPAKCNQYTGQCECKVGVTGLRCDRCKANTFDFKSKKGCKSCNCHPQGSETLKCNDKGRCTCRILAEGPKCDKCKENAHNMHKGCVHCPKCYNFVQEVSTNYDQKLKNFTQLVDDAEPMDVAGHEDFKRSVKELLKNIIVLYENSTKTDAVIREKEVTKIKNRLNVVAKEITKGKKSVSKNKKLHGLISDKNANNAKTMSAVHDNLQIVNKSVAGALKEFENAIKRSAENDKFDTEIAATETEGTTIVEAFEKELKGFQETVASLNDSCVEACNSSIEFGKIAEDLSDTKLQIASTKEDVTQRKQVAEKLSKETWVIKEDAQGNQDAMNDLDYSNFYIDLDEYNRKSKDILNGSEIIDVKDLPKFVKIIDESKKKLERAAKVSEAAYLELNKKKDNLTKQTEIVKEYNTQLNAAEQLAKAIKIDIYDGLEKLAKNTWNLTDDFAYYIKDINKKLKVIEDEIDEYSRNITKANIHVDSLQKQTKEMEDLIKLKQKIVDEYNKYLEYLDKLPLKNEQLDELEKIIVKYEERNAVYDQMIGERDHIKLELQSLKEIAESLDADRIVPNNDTKNCFKKIEYEGKVNIK